MTAAILTEYHARAAQLHREMAANGMNPGACAMHYLQAAVFALEAAAKEQRKREATMAAGGPRNSQAASGSPGCGIVAGNSGD